MLELKDSSYLLPGPYPGEHLFSMVNRLWSYSDPYLSSAQLIDIFRGKVEVFDPLNPVSFCNFLSAKELLKYTTYPYFLWSQPVWIQQTFQDLIRENFKSSYLYLLPQNKYADLSREQDRKVYYCSDCAREDWEDYHECYLRVEHQIDGLNVCLKHNAVLNEILLDTYHHKPFFVFDESYIKTSEPASSEEIVLTRLLTNPPEIDRDEILDVIESRFGSDAAGEGIYEQISSTFSETFLKKKKVNAESIDGLLDQFSNDHFVHPIALGTVLLGLDLLN